MKATELRIGNYIQWEDESNDLAEVIGIYEPKEKLLQGGYWLNIKTNNEIYPAMIDEFVGIELTEQWLKDFGFTQSDDDWDWWIDWSKERETFKACKYIDSNSYAVIGLGDFKYVHQLQNLYFALTGEELTLKNKKK